jgi:hypothetical protein
LFYLNDGKGHFGSGILIKKGGGSVSSMIAVDLDGDNRPEIVIGYVNAPVIFFVNDGTGKKYRQVPFGVGHGTIYGMAEQI